MMSKRVKRNRIGLAFAGITAGMLALWAPNAQATGEDRTPVRPTVVRVDAPAAPTREMRAALRHCAPAPKDVRQACHSLYLRPATSEWPSGKAIVAECHGQARHEARAYPGPRTYADYMRGCVLGNIATP